MSVVYGLLIVFLPFIGELPIVGGPFATIDQCKAAEQAWVRENGEGGVLRIECERVRWIQPQ